MTDFEEYLKRYCESRGIPESEARQHVLVKEYEKYCEEKSKRIEPTKVELSCGCAGATAY